jgi:WD40 repeat protein
VRALTGHDTNVRSVAFSPDGRTLASGSDTGEVKLWETSSGKLLYTLTSGHSAYSVAISSDGTLLGAANDRTIVLWDLPRLLQAVR